MTPDHDPLPDDGPLDDDTLAVHAVVDDEATPEQRRRVARDPELVGQVAALRATIAAVAAPVDPPPGDVLAALRRRALDALDEPETATDPEPEPEEDDGSADDGAGPGTPPTAPVRDLDAARARRTRRLPPLPAVAAVVVLLVLVGVGLILAGTGDQGESSADGASSATGEDSAGETVVADADDGAGGDDAPATESADETFSENLDRPADEIRDELLGQVTAHYDADEDLLDDLREVDPLALPLTARSASGEGQTPSSTTAPATTPPGASTTTTPDLSASARALAADPVATRCDDVVRAAEPDLEPAVAAALVEVDGEPVLVLSNPVEVTERSPSGLRLTVLNAIDCSPRGAVLR